MGRPTWTGSATFLGTLSVGVLGGKLASEGYSIWVPVAGIGGATVLWVIGRFRDPPPADEIERRKAEAARQMARGHAAERIGEVCFQYRDGIDRQIRDFLERLTGAMRSYGATDRNSPMIAAVQGALHGHRFDLGAPDWVALVREAEENGLEGGPLREVKARADELVGVMRRFNGGVYGTTYQEAQIAIGLSHGRARGAAMAAEEAFGRLAAEALGYPFGGPRPSR